MMATIRMLLLLVVMLGSAVANPATFILPKELHSSQDIVGNVCPDRAGSDTKTSCASTSTCCAIGSGYGCCPLEDAVCCGNGEHCCPKGHVCDNSKGVCRKANLPINAESIDCPDGKSQCKSGQTCCLTDTGNYGCCPVSNAVCCSDRVHCCPAGDTCDTSDRKCISPSNSFKVSDMLKKQPALPKLKPPVIDANIVCPDEKSECSSGQTCCKTINGTYGCCPEINAVCCSDEIHCCPAGYTCADSNDGKCISPSNSFKVSDMLKKQPALPKLKPPVIDANIVCPDRESECPSGQTCCKTINGAYGCCPDPNAVCCSDGVHCCPENDICDTSAGKCLKPSSTEIIPLKERQQVVPLVKMAETSSVIKGEVCNNNEVKCAVGFCCLVTTPSRRDTAFMCCDDLSTNSQCCPPEFHYCCPKGTNCVQGKDYKMYCEKSDSTVATWFDHANGLL